MATPRLDRAACALDQLIDELVTPSADLRAVSLRKRRAHYMIADCGRWRGSDSAGQENQCQQPEPPISSLPRRRGCDDRTGRAPVRTQPQFDSQFGQRRTPAGQYTNADEGVPVRIRASA